jgi:hypothetical protein
MTASLPLRNRYGRLVLAGSPRGAIGAFYARAPQVLSEGSPVLLALNAPRWRGELQVLSEQGLGIRVMPYEWQTRFLPWFSGRGVDYLRWFDPEPGSQLERERSRYRAFLAKGLGGIDRKVPIGCVIGAAVHYIQDLDWGAAAQSRGVPYVVLHKENLVMSPGARAETVRVLGHLGKFIGERVIVHNELMRRVFIDSGFVAEDRVIASGSPRMDPFLEHVQKAPEPSKENVVLLFSFFHATGLMGLIRRDSSAFRGVWAADGKSGFVDLFRITHQAIARYALEHPDTRVIIKTKWAGSWTDRIHEVLNEVGLDPDRLPNLEITDRGDAQELILRARAVVGFGSTTLLEAAVAARPVITPHFAEVNDPAYEEFVPFGDEPALFQRATSEAHLVALIDEAVADSSVPPAVLSARRDAFDRYVTPFDGGATGRVASVLRDLAKRR